MPLPDDLLMEWARAGVLANARARGKKPTADAVEAAARASIAQPAFRVIVEAAEQFGRRNATQPAVPRPRKGVAVIAGQQRLFDGDDMIGGSDAA